MRKILIATHGEFAGGIVNTINMLIGERQDITYINAYTDSSDFTIQAEKFIQSNQDNEIVVFTDLYGGSVNQKLTQMKNHYSFYLISGFNLSLVLAVLLDEMQLSQSLIEELISQSRQEMQLVTLDEGIQRDVDFFED